MRKSFIRLDVYFQSMTSTIIKEEPKLSVSFEKKSSVEKYRFSLQYYELFCDLGGGLSLVLGISLAMLFEFLELLLDLMYFAGFSKSTQKKEENDQ